METQGLDTPQRTTNGSDKHIQVTGILQSYDMRVEGAFYVGAYK